MELRRENVVEINDQIWGKNTWEGGYRRDTIVLIVRFNSVFLNGKKTIFYYPTLSVFSLLTRLRSLWLTQKVFRKVPAVTVEL